MPVAEQEDDSKLVDAYLRTYKLQDNSLLWAFSELHVITLHDTERGWRITLALIAGASNEGVLGYVAAGPLEEMLEVHGNEIIDRVEALAHTDEKFRKALSLVACFEDSMPSDICARVHKALGRI